MIDIAVPRPGSHESTGVDEVEEHNNGIEHIRHRMGHALARGKDTTVEWIQRNPYAALGIAAGVGFLAGLILKRR